MMPQQAVLLLGAFTLAGCGAGLVLVHDTNPLLKGLNWMGAALVVGGASCALRLGGERYAVLLPVAECCFLLAFLCCYRADRYLSGLSNRLNAGSTAILVLQGCVMLAFWSSFLSPGRSTAVSSLLMATQLGLIIDVVRRDAIGKMRLACRFSVGLMSFFLMMCLLRAGTAAAGYLFNSPLAEPLNLLSYMVFVAGGIALAFAFFWRTTAKLSMELEHMASTDPLTRVFNRRVFMSWCESEQQRSRRLHAPFSLLMLDFDHFKQVNDTFGHHVGDQVLCAAVERIQDSIRGIDVLCRWGGEEFAVLLPNASEEATQIVAERVRRNVRLLEAADARFSDPLFADLRLSASIGTATFEGEDDTYQLMLQRADAALYEAKRTGRNRVVRAPRERVAAGYTGTPVTAEA